MGTAPSNEPIASRLSSFTSKANPEGLHNDTRSDAKDTPSALDPPCVSSLYLYQSAVVQWSAFYLSTIRSLYLFKPWELQILSTNNVSLIVKLTVGVGVILLRKVSRPVRLGFAPPLGLKSKAIPVTGRGGGSWDVKDPTLFRQSAHRRR
jgi:hypothetical protein